MAKINLRVDASNQGDATTPDAKFLARAELVVTATGGLSTWTTSEKLAHVAGVLNRYMIDLAKGEKRRQRQAAAAAVSAGDDADLSD